MTGMYDRRFTLTHPALETPRPLRSIPQLSAELIAAWNEHDPERVAGFYAPDYLGQDVAQAGAQSGPRDVRLMTAYYLRAFPDLQIALEDLVVQGDRAVLAWTWRGTQHGTFLHIPPTRRSVSVGGVTRLTVIEGLIWRSARVWDLAGLLRSLGLLPDLQE